MVLFGTINIGAGYMVKVGDWVTSYYKGIWKVYRIIDDFYEFRYSLNEDKVLSNRILVLSNRIVNDKWKRSFTSASCEQSLIKPLSAENQASLNDILKTEPKLSKAFENYKPKPVDIIMNLSFGLPDNQLKKSFTSACDILFADKIGAGMNFDKILVELGTFDLSQFIGKNPQNATLQLTCNDHELVDREFIFRSYRVLGH
jgi:hypothetical protein